MLYPRLLWQSLSWSTFTRLLLNLPLKETLGRLLVFYVTFFTLKRDHRRVELEQRLQADSVMPEDRKMRQLQNLGRKESTFLRLRRTKLGLDDFRTVKVIGKGAFGEVCCRARTMFSG
jgi:hypothetical protein